MRSTRSLTLSIYRILIMSNNLKSKYLMREKLKQLIEGDRGWYFITYRRNLPSNRPYDFCLFGEPFVLFRDKKNDLVCYSLLSLYKSKTGDRAATQSFEIVEKQSEIWFYRGKIR